MDSFKSKYGSWALITGATSGIGAELTSQIAAKGLNIVLVARKENELKDHAAKLKERYGIETKYVSADLATESGIEKVKQIQEEIGLLVLAAGFEVNGAFEKTDLESELKVIQINVVATLELTHHFSKVMVQRKRGGIFVTDSKLVRSLSGDSVFHRVT